MLAYSSDLNKEGTIYDGPSFVDVTKEEVIAIYDKWEEEVRVIVQVISLKVCSIYKTTSFDLIFGGLSKWKNLLDGQYVQ